MSSEPHLGGAPLTVRVNKRARTLRLRVDPRTGGITLTVPKGVSQRRALEWAVRHEDWARRSRLAVPQATALVPGALLPFCGRSLHVQWDAAQGRKIDVMTDSIRVGGPLELVEPRLLRWLRQQAREVLTRETLEFAALAEVRIGRVSVGDPVSRWGSCSSNGNVRYSWRLIMAPDFVRRATVAHEVAHRVHMDHSPNFHAEVRRLLGEDPTPAREWLRREGAGLHRVGRSTAAD